MASSVRPSDSKSDMRRFSIGYLIFFWHRQIINLPSNADVGGERVKIKWKKEGNFYHVRGVLL